MIDKQETVLKLDDSFELDVSSVDPTWIAEGESPDNIYIVRYKSGESFYATVHSIRMMIKNLNEVF